MNYKDNNTEYKKINLSTKLRTDVLNKVNDLYDKLSNIFEGYAIEGKTNIIIFVPINSESQSLDKYDIKMDNYYEYFQDKNLFHLLKKKLKSEGIKSNKYNAVDHYDYIKNDYGEKIKKSITGGLILKFKWDKNYSKKTCNLM